MPTADEEASERADALVGRTLDGRYRIDRILATGAMGTVYLARHVKLKKRVALKVLHPDVEAHEELVLRFEREAAAGARVSHPGVATATDFGDLEDGTRYLVMEYVRGETLRAVIDRDAPLSVERAVRIARQIAVALDAIHKDGIVHRDLKPRNVMLATNDFVKLVDFGLAKLDHSRFSALPEDEAEADARLTGRGVIFGTVEYLAPEAALGMDRVDARSDLYALGVMLFEMLAGRHPFEAKSDAELFTKHRLAKLPRIVDRNPDARVSAGLENVVRRLLEKDPGDRFETAGTLIAELDREAPEGSTPPPEPIEPPPSSQEDADLSSAKSSRSADSDDLRKRTQIRRSKLTPARPPPEASASDTSKQGAPSAGPSSKPSSTKSDATPRTTAPPASSQRAPSIEIHEDVEPIDGAEERAALVPPSSVRQPAEPKSLTPWIVGGVLVVAVAAWLLASRERPPEAVPGSASPTTPPTSVASVRPSAPSTPAASSTPTSTTTATTSASAALAPVDANELLAQVKGWTTNAELEPAIDAAKRLLEIDPQAATVPDRAAVLSALLVAVLDKSHPRADEIWKVVALSAGGTDLLFQWVENKGDSPPSRKAHDMLALPDVRAKFSKALAIALDLREANTCAEKLALVDRAIAEGDERAINALDLVARGCMKSPARIEEGIKKMRKRLARERAATPSPSATP